MKPEYWCVIQDKIEKKFQSKEKALSWAKRFEGLMGYVPTVHKVFYINRPWRDKIL